MQQSLVVDIQKDCLRGDAMELTVTNPAGTRVPAVMMHASSMAALSSSDAPVVRAAAWLTI